MNIKNNLIMLNNATQRNATQRNATNLNFLFKIFFHSCYHRINRSISLLHNFLMLSKLISFNTVQKIVDKTNFIINNYFIRSSIMNKKNIIAFIAVLSIFFIFTGCKTVSTASVIPQSLQLSGSDITVGEVLIAEMPYSKDENLKEQLIAKALKDSKYDFLIMPRYEIVQVGLSKKMRVIGRGAKVK